MAMHPHDFFNWKSTPYLLSKLKELMKVNPTDEDICWIKLVLIRRKIID